MMTYVRTHVTITPLTRNKSFKITKDVTVLGVSMGASILLTFERVKNRDTLVFKYKLPLGINRVAGRFQDELTTMIPNQIIEIERDHITLYPARIDAEVLRTLRNNRF